MKEFTIKNIFKCWLKLWPATVILIVAGAGIGVWQAKSLTQRYETNTKVLIVNNDNSALAADYAGLAGSMLVRETAEERAGTTGCSTGGAGAGNVVTLSVACTESEEDALKLLATLRDTYEEKLKELYGDKIERVVVISGESAVKTKVTGKTKLMKAAVPVVGGMLLSLAIAFVYTDYITRKHGKKK